MDDSGLIFRSLEEVNEPLAGDICSGEIKCMGIFDGT